MRRLLIGILAMALLASGASVGAATGIYGLIDSWWGEDTLWTGDIPWAFVEPDEPFSIRLIHGRRSPDLGGLMFDLHAFGPIDLVSVRTLGDAPNLGSWIPGLDGESWTQQIRVPVFDTCVPAESPVVLLEIVLQKPGRWGSLLQILGPPDPPHPYSPYGFDCVGTSFEFEYGGFPRSVCVNCPDPLTDGSFGMLKATYRADLP